MKVRILNAAHTALVPNATVQCLPKRDQEAVEDSRMGMII